MDYFVSVAETYIMVLDPKEVKTNTLKYYEITDSECADVVWQGCATAGQKMRCFLLFCYETFIRALLK